MPKLYYRAPKVRTYKGKKYHIWGIEGTVKPKAIATFYAGPKYGQKKVVNLSMRVALAKGLNMPNKKGYSTGKKII